MNTKSQLDFLLRVAKARVHTDRGSQYASWAHRELVEHCGMVMSMSLRANVWDNASMESFFKKLKVEQTSRCRCETRAQARLDVVDWIEGFYNRQHIHSSIGYRTPCDYEAMQKAALTCSPRLVRE